MNELFRDTAKKLHRAHTEFTEARFKEALLKECDGVLPSNEELTKRGTIVIDHHGVKHLFWDAPKLNIGDAPDWSKCIASVAPPKIYTP